MKISPQHQDPENPSQDARPRRKGGRRRILLAAAILAALAGAFALNGPVFRAALRAALERGAAAAGLEGSAEVTGTLLSGPRLAEGAFEGTGPLRSLRFEFLEIDYQLLKLAREGVFGGLTGIRARGLAVVLEGVAGEEAGEVAEKDRVPTDEGAASPWKFTAIRNVPIRLEDAAVQWREKGAVIWEIEGLDFTLASGGKGELALARLAAPGERVSENLRAVIRINESSAEIEDLALLEDVRIAHLLVEKHPVLPAVATGSLELCGGRIALEFTPEGHWRATLAGGAVDLAALDALLGLAWIEEGFLDGLDARLLDGEVLSGDGSLSMKNLRARGHSLDSARFGLRVASGRLDFDSIEIAAGENRLEGTGSILLPREGAGAPPDWLEDLSGRLSLRAPRPDTVLDAFDLPLSGDVTADIAFAFTGGTLARCDGNLAGSELTWADAPLGSIAAELSCPRPGVAAADARVDIGPATGNTVAARVDFELATSRYEGTATAAMKNIGAMQPVLAAAGLETTLGGKAAADWSGSGDFQEEGHGGKLSFSNAAVRIGDGEEVRGRGRLAYDTLGFDASGLEFAAGAFTVRGGASLSGGILTLSSVRLSKGETELAEVELTLPFGEGAHRSARNFFAQEGPVVMNLRCKPLSIEELYAIFSPGGVSPVGGTVSGSLAASGSLPELKLDSSIKVTGVEHSALEGAAPAEIDAALTMENGRLRIGGTARQELMEPVTIAGEADFDPQRWAEDPASWKGQKIALSVDLPGTDLSVFRPFFPAVTRLQGTASAKMRLEGTVGAPHFSGDLRAAIPLLKFRRQRIPTVRDADIALVLDGREIRVESGGAEVAGGLVQIGGKVSFESGLSDPLLDLSLGARQALVARDDYLNLRANADITLDGPFTGATLAGAIAISESRYSRDIEILPLDFLRRTPAPPRKAAALRAVTFEPSITAAPFNRWILDLRITTADPFLVRGNLANADATADLTVTGTGAAPVIEGKVVLLDGEATLPFSKLKVERGELVFDGSGGIVPRVNLEGVSSVREYEVRIQVYGSVLDPKVILRSNPPLPQEDIATLLASGSTRDELGDREAVASRAFQLLARETARKVFRRGSRVDDKEILPEDLELSFGQTDQRTGRRTVSSLYRVTPNLFLIGSVDEGGDSRGLVKFLVRFW